MAVELADAEAAADLRTYLERARRFDPEGAARLQSTPTALAVWTCARPGSGPVSYTHLTLPTICRV